MSKIQQIQPNYQQKLTLKSENSKNFAPNQSFGKSSIVLSNEGKVLYETCKKGIITPGIRLSDILAKNEGEIENQLITFIFTSTLAPLMIATNPFSKKDKKDKEYLALRQPISAIIAIAGSMPATIALNTQMAKWGAEGRFDGLDMRIAPHKDYLKKGFKQELKLVKNNPVALTEFEKYVGLSESDKALRTSKSFLDRFDYKSSLKVAYYDKIKGEIKEFMSALAFASKGKVDCKDGKVRILDEYGNPKMIKNSRTGQLEEFSRVIPQVTDQPSLEVFLKKYNLHDFSFANFMKERFNLKFYGDGKIKPNSALNKLKEIKAKDFLVALGIIDEKFDGEELRKLVSISRQGKTVEESNLSKEVVAALAKQGTRDTQAQVGEKVIKEANVSLNQLINRLGILGIVEPEEPLTDSKAMEAIKNQQLNALQKLMERPMAEIMKIFREAMENNGFKDKFKDEQGIEKIAERYIKKMAGNADDYFKNWMKFYGIGTNLFLVAITSTILNWIYPRAMEKFFPSLLKKDPPSVEKKGGNK